MRIDTSYITHSDSFNNLGIESSLEMLSQPVRPAILGDIGEADDTTHSSLSDGSGPTPDPLIELDDFFKLIQNLPGLYFDKTSHYYYVRGKIAKSSQETFYNYAKRIGTLTLGHPSPSSNHGAKWTISPQVFLRLGQLQDPDGSLLPSLHRLQICTSDGSYLDHLDLFLSSSLESLEISKMPTDVGHNSSIMSFLYNIAEVSPDLENLILGPFELPQQLLDSCVKFKQLQRLELRGVLFSTTDTILGDIGSLEHLKEFILEERKKSPVDFAVSQAEAAAAPPMRNASTMSNLFPSLKTLQIVGTSDLIEKVVSGVTSPDLCELSITFTTITSNMRTMRRKKEKMESTVFILKNVIERWASLISVAVIADAGKTAFLPNDILRDLLLQPELKRLEINGFDISSIASALPEVVGEAYSSQLETLLLPVTNSVPLSRLRPMAMAWPNLTSLRCKLDLASWVHPTMVDPISHKLESLTVASDDQSSPVQQPQGSRLLKVAAYIDRLFPDLTEMEVVADDFGRQLYQHEPEWVQVFDMLRLLQTVRAHDRQRFRASCLTAAAAAEQLYDSVMVWKQQGSLTVTGISLPLFQQFFSSITPGTFGSPTVAYQTILSSVEAFADEFTAVKAKCTPADAKGVDVPNPHPQVQVTFNVVAYTQPDGAKDIFLTGSLDVLKNWSPDNAIALSADKYPTWSVTLTLPANTNFKYKYIRKCNGVVTWEVNPNNSNTTPASSTCSYTINDHWRS